MRITRRSVSLASVVLLGVAAASAAGVHYAASSTATPDVSAVQDVVGEALYQQYALGTPSKVQHGRAPHTFTTPKITVDASQHAEGDNAPDAAEVSERRNLGKNAIDTVFSQSSDALKKRVNLAYTNTIAAAGDPNGRFLGAGISKLTFEDTTISGDTATVHATATIWSTTQQKGPDGKWMTAEPSGDKSVTGTVKKTPQGVWVIDDLVSSYLPNSQP